MKLKWYLGLAGGGTTRTVFCEERDPTQETHGARFAAVIGPFKTARSAEWARVCGRNNPHFQTVADAERLCRNQARREAKPIGSNQP